MLLINYFRWMRRWRVNWQAENWRDESGDAYQCFIEWHRDRKRQPIADAVRVAKSRRDILRLSLPKPPTRWVADASNEAHSVAVAINRVTHPHGVHVTLRREVKDGIEVYVGKNGRHDWTESFLSEPLIANITSEVADFRYNVVLRRPEVVAFYWTPKYSSRQDGLIDHIAREILHRWQRVEDEFQVTQQMKLLSFDERQALVSLAETHYVYFDGMSYNPRLHRILARMTEKGLCEIIRDSLGAGFRANDKTRLVAALSKAETK